MFSIRLGVVLFPVTTLFIALARGGNPATDSAFVYQGQLKQNGAPFNGACNMRFKLRTNPFGADDTDVLATIFFDGSDPARPPVEIRDGLFDVVLDFPLSSLVQRPVWLDIGVECPPGAQGFYQGLMPRQKLESVPFSAQTWGIAVDEFGNVGIGTTDPIGTLHVDGRENTGTNAALRVESGSQTLLIDGDEIDSSATLFINKNSGTDMALGMGGGNVGIGTSTPQADLHLQSTLSTQIRLEADTDNLGEADQPSILMSQDGGLISGSVGFSDQQNSMSLRTNDTGSGVAHLLLLPEGNVGVGISNQLSTGKLVIGQDDDTADEGLSIFDSTAGQSLRLWVDPEDVRRIDGGGNGQATVAINGTGAGNVGIGTTTPQAKLHVAGDVHVDGGIGMANQDRFLMLTPDSFVAAEPGLMPRRVLMLGDVSGTEIVEFSAAVNLPHGAEVDRITAWIRDQRTGSLEYVRVELRRWDPLSRTSLLMASVDSDPNGSGGYTSSPATDPIIDNENYGYRMETQWVSQSVDTFGQEIGVSGVRIKYRVNSPLP